MTSLFRNRWWVVFATICGLLVGAGPINVFTFGVFLKPITEDLGLSRGTFSMALTVHAAIAAIVLPIIGWLVDRWGARRITLRGLFLLCASHRVLRADPSLAPPPHLSDLCADRSRRRGSIADPLRRGDRRVVRSAPRPCSRYRHRGCRPWPPRDRDQTAGIGADIRTAWTPRPIDRSARCAVLSSPVEAVPEPVIR